MDFHETWRNLVATLDDNSPKIKIVVGVIGLIGAGVAAAVAATKIKEDVKEEANDLENIKKARKTQKEQSESPNEVYALYSDKDFAKDVVNLGWRYTVKGAKRFGVPLLVGTASAVLIFNGANVLSDRLSGTTEALATITTAYSNYRKGVIDRYGENVDQEIRLGVKEQKITQEEVIVDENGKEKVVKKSVKAKVANGDPALCSPYAFYVDESCTQFMKDITQLEMYARAQQTLLNQQMRLGSRKWVTLAEIYDIFGRPQEEYTQDSLVVGIVYDEKNDNADSDNYVDFRCQRVFKFDEDGKCVSKLLIDPNVEGSIYDKLPKALRYSNEDSAV